MSAQDNVIRIGSHLWAEYQKTTPKQLQVIDHFAAFSVVNGALLMLYLILNGSFPYNSFLSAFIAAVAFFVFIGQYHLRLRPPSLHHPVPILQTHLTDRVTGFCCVCVVVCQCVCVCS